MPAKLRSTGKRKLDLSPSKVSTDFSISEVTLKKAKNSSSVSPKKSPSKPLLQHDIHDSATFVAKSFYGFKHSGKGNDNYPKTPPKKYNGKPICENLPPSLLNGKALSPNLRVNEVMLQRIASSPIKQAFLQTCSVEQFRKLYREEFKEIEKDVERENKKAARGISRIVTSRDEEEEDNDYEGSDISNDDEIVFKVSNHGLDCDDIDRQSLRKQPIVVLQSLEDNEEAKDNETSLYDDEDEDSKSSKDADEPLHEVMASGNNSPVSTPSSGGKKFFKTKSPAHSLSMQVGKGFSLKFSPKAVSAGLKQKKTKKRLKKSGTPFKKHTPIVSGVFCVPGFLSPTKDSGTNDDSHSPTGDMVDQEDIAVNKTININYMVTTPSKSCPEGPTGNASPGSSIHDSRSDEVDLLCSDASSEVSSRQSTPAGKNGSEDLFSSQSQGSGKSGVRTPSSKSKLFPIFYKKANCTDDDTKINSQENEDKVSPSRDLARHGKDGGNQMILDAGQRLIGVTQCAVCGMVYSHAEPEDEHAHAKFHKTLLEALKFPGWKKERCVQEYPDDLSRVLLVLPDDPKYARKKVEELSRVMGRELGFPDVSTSSLHPFHRIFFYVSSEKEIEGCCMAEPISEGYRVISGDLDHSQASGQRPWCCTTVPEAASVGISRLWVAASCRRSGVATKLVDCVRQWFDYGSLIPKHQVAFSDPTADGRSFAQKYMGTPNFLVYKFKQ